MIQDDEKQQSDAQVEREIRGSRRFTPEEALGRMAGPGAMKGASPVSPQQQAEVEIGTWLRSHLTDPAGALKVVVHRHLKGSKALQENPDLPLSALAEHIQRALTSDELLRETVREADVEWGRAMDERPYFEPKSGSHPDDPYTVQSVRGALSEALAKLRD